MVSQGAKQEIVAEWMENQGNDSWGRQARAYKAFLGRQLQVEEADVAWVKGRKNAEAELKAWLNRWGPEGERALTVWHAFVQEVLGGVAFDNNDRLRRVVRLTRTGDKIVINKYGLKFGRGLKMPGGLNKSSSVFRTTRVHGSEITVQAVPHTRVTGLYLLERKPGASIGAFLGDNENEFTFIPAGLPFDYVKSVSESAGQDATGWRLELSHLRQP